MNKKEKLGVGGIICIIIAIILWGSESYIFSIIVGFIGITLFAGVNQTIKDEKDKKKKDKNLDDLNKLSGFKATNKINLNFGLIAIDDESWKIAIKSGSDGIRKFNYNDILKCEINEDGVTTYSKSTMRTIGGGLLGGAIAGNAGAVIGGLSGKSQQNKKTKHIDLKIVVKSTKNPNISLRFFDAGDATTNTEKSIDESSSLYGHILTKAKADIEKWKNIIEVIINKVDKKERKSEQVSNISTVDELIKLNELKEKGILTEEEFNEQKKKILKQ